MEAAGSPIKRTYDFGEGTFSSTAELISFADRLVEIVGREAGEVASCRVVARPELVVSIGEEESMPLEEFRSRANDFDEFQIPDYRRRLIGQPFLLLSFDVTTPDGLLAQFSHANNHHKVDICGSDKQLVEDVWRRIEEDRERRVAEAVEKADAEAAEREAEEARKKAAEVAEARRWRNRLNGVRGRGWARCKAAMSTSAAKWVAGVVGAIISGVAVALIAAGIFHVSPP